MRTEVSTRRHFIFCKQAMILFAIVLLMIQHVYAQTTPGNRTDDVHNVKKIVMAGNSITYGGGDWGVLLGRSDVTNWGIPGYTTEQISWTIKNFAKYKPAVCFLEGGINDVSLGISVKRVFRNQKRMIDTLRAYNIIPVIQSTIYQVAGSANNKQVRKLNKLISTYCAQQKIAYIDLNSVLSPNGALKEEFTTDGTHLKQPAYTEWAKVVKEMLQKLGID